jgi:hypothetical protein
MVITITHLILRLKWTQRSVDRVANKSISNEPGLAQAHKNSKSSRAELVKRFKLESLIQTQVVTIQVGSRTNACILTMFDIYI